MKKYKNNKQVFPLKKQTHKNIRHDIKLPDIGNFSNNTSDVTLSSWRKALNLGFYFIC